MEKISADENKTSWELLTEKQKKKLEEEYRALQIWYEGKKKEIEKALKAEGKWQLFGLDANQEYFGDIIKERNQRLRTLQEKYGFLKSTD